MRDLTELATALGQWDLVLGPAPLAAALSLKEAGVLAVEDLAFIGNRDILPEDVVSKLPRGVDVEGFSEAIHTLFRIARNAADGNASILLLQARRAEPSGTQAEGLNPSLVSRASKLLKAFCAEQPKQGVTILLGPAKTAISLQA